MGLIDKIATYIANKIAIGYGTPVNIKGYNNATPKRGCVA